MMETWIKVKGFERYEVCDKGCVRNAKTGDILKPTLNTWGSIKDAEQSGFHHSAISACCHGRRKQHGGFAWGYAV